ncbi:MAG: 2'-5' RNA ligase [Elusimicrobia bacterium GWA2_61_42]|nr:MAG: 2'-5' RNA ligase [Elusimicrobia bacterium GWA2_61_42]OGR80314.1 MAG: 2'-5' RNA ligase [Elusimicrobia bacterium GWC2_61_25]
MRLFVASAFEPAFTAHLKAAADYARDNAGRDAVKWTAPSDFHITYAFLGDLDKKAADAAARGMDAGLAGLKRFSVVSGGLGVFPSPRHPSVLWIGIGEGAAELRELANKLSEGLAANGLIFENRFEPHVTIGRVKRPLPEDFFRRAGGYTSARRASSAVSSVELMESRLTPEGPVYTEVYSRKLL